MLDLSAHNPLLNFKHGRSNRYVRIVDELPNQIVAKLLDGKPMGFEPVPRPTEDTGEFGLLDWKEGGKTKRDSRPKNGLQVAESIHPSKFP